MLVTNIWLSILVVQILGSGLVIWTSELDNFRDKKLRTTSSSCIQQNGGPDAFMSATVQDKGRSYAYTNSVRNGGQSFADGFHFPTGDRRSGLYGFEFEPNAIWNKKYEHYFRSSGSIATPVETPYDFRRPKRTQPKVNTFRAKTPYDFRRPKRTQPKVNTFWAKRMRWSGGSPNHQSAITQSFGTTHVETQGLSSMYVDIGDCQCSCNHYGARFWYGERLKGYTNTQYLKYNKCCGAGKVVLQQQRDPPHYMKELLKDRRFLDNIRAYNQMFAMTSFGAHVDESINNRRGPYVFKISGQIYHWIGAMCPSSGDAPRLLQLYIYDTEHEVANRMRHFRGAEADGLDPQIVESLISFLDEHNELYDLPTSHTLGAIVFKNEPDTAMDYDVVIEPRDGFPKRISRLHQSYMSLQFPLLFVYGELGYYPEMQQNRSDDKRVSMTAYYMYQLHECFGLYGLPFRCRRLFQQYLVGVYCCIEQNRIDYYRTHQNDIRKDFLSGVFDAIHKGDRIGSDIGGRLILPCSFTGGPRYMYSHYLDALAICRVLGNPQFFITFTCNVNWTEIKRHMDEFPQIIIAYRADVVVRVFEQKFHEFCNFLQHSRRFGDVTRFLYTIEFQKQGLPHYPETDPEGYRVVSEMMVHGPCGPTHADAVCMKEGTCSKKYPKKYNNETFFDKDGHVHYRRRESDVYVARHSAELDNSNVVPFNRELCLTFHAHINVEYCGWSMLIKYQFKYILKGIDRIYAKVTKPV
ncbi:DNA helicase [Tanacetum coccineum]